MQHHPELLIQGSFHKKPNTTISQSLSSPVALFVLIVCMSHHTPSMHHSSPSSSSSPAQFDEVRPLPIDWSRASGWFPDCVGPSLLCLLSDFVLAFAPSLAPPPLILLCGGFAVDSPGHEWSVSWSPGGSGPNNSVQWARIVSHLTQNSLFVRHDHYVGSILQKSHKIILKNSYSNSAMSSVTSYDIIFHIKLNFVALSVGMQPTLSHHVFLPLFFTTY